MTDACDVGSGTSLDLNFKTNVVTKSGNAPFGHCKLNGDYSEANSNLFSSEISQNPKSRVPEPTSRLTLNRGRLVRMVDQDGGKLECL